MKTIINNIYSWLISMAMVIALAITITGALFFLLKAIIHIVNLTQQGRIDWIN